MSNADQDNVGADAPWTTRRLLRWIQGHLEDKDVDSPRVCSELLVGHAIASERLKLDMEPDRVASDEELGVLRDLVARAGRHEPVQYLVGSWPSLGREFEVKPCTLIPRPATECLVEQALEHIESRGFGKTWRILDLCTGSGCIGVSLAASLAGRRAGRVSDRHEQIEDPDSVVQEQPLPVIDLEQQPVDTTAPVPTSPIEEPSASAGEPGPIRVVATDLIEDCLELTRRNAVRNGVDSILDCRTGSLFDALDSADAGGFHLICTNPPYVTDAEYDRLDRNVREYEPASALRGGGDGLDLIRPILEQAGAWLAPGGLLLVEIGDSQHQAVLELAASIPGLEAPAILKDHEGFHRILRVRAAIAAGTSSS